MKERYRYNVIEIKATKPSICRNQKMKKTMERKKWLDEGKLE